MSLLKTLIDRIKGDGEAADGELQTILRGREPGRLARFPDLWVKHPTAEITMEARGERVRAIDDPAVRAMKSEAEINKNVREECERLGLDIHARSKRNLYGQLMDRIARNEKKTVEELFREAKETDRFTAFVDHVARDMETMKIADDIAAMRRSYGQSRETAVQFHMFVWYAWRCAEKEIGGTYSRYWPTIPAMLEALHEPELDSIVAQMIEIVARSHPDFLGPSSSDPRHGTGFAISPSQN